MSMPKPPGESRSLRPSQPIWQITHGPTGPQLSLTGAWLSHDTALPCFTSEDLDRAAQAETSRACAPSLQCDASGVAAWDTGLVAFLWDVRRAYAQAGVTFDTSSLPHPMRQLLDLLPDTPPPARTISCARRPFLETLGASFLALLAETGILAGLAGKTIRAAFRALFGRSGMRGSDLLTDFVNAGPSALIIVGVVNFLVGAILAFVGAVQLQKFAAGIYVASLVGIATVREMAAVMTAIIMAGRTGGAYAARISTMQGNEEIDALRVFGIPVSSYLILPAVLSLVITMPLLYLYGCLIGMLGGYVVAISMLDITSLGYFHQTVIAFGIGQFLFGFIKSIVFGAFIGLTSCRIGLKAGRSAADVGIAATRAVVIGIVGVIALDAIFAVIANSVGI